MSNNKQRRVRVLTGGLYEYVSMLISREIVSRPVGSRISVNLDLIEDKYESTKRRWESKVDELSRACEELESKLEELRATSVPLLMGKDGKLLHIGDEACLHYCSEHQREIVGVGEEFVFFGDGTFARAEVCVHWVSPRERAEGIIRELTLGNLTETEAVEAIAEILEVG